MTLPQLPQDKANHFIYGAAICLILSFVIPALYAMLVAVGVGIAKEIYDRVGQKGTPDLMDALVTALGAILVYIATIV